MKLLRRLSLLALGVAMTHLVFGAIVRISGSGMGCGDNWPRCYGRWFPPLSRPDLIIEVSHRYLAALLVVTLGILLSTAWHRRAERGVSGRGGVLRSAGLAVALVLTTAAFGGVTVKLGNAPFATVGHWLLAALTIASVATAAMRAGALGSTRAMAQEATPRARRGAAGAVAVALIVILLGGLTAKVPGASWSCLGFPVCNGKIVPTNSLQVLQLTHRVFAILLFLHIVGLTIGLSRRKESRAVRGAVYVVLGLIVAQIGVAAAMVSTLLPPALRSLHQAIGVLIWVSVFTMAYLARIASGASAIRGLDASAAGPVLTRADGAQRGRLAEEATS
jgi:heme A synthase